MGGESRGSIAFFATYRPPVPLDIFSCPVPPSSAHDELRLSDGDSYNYNGRPIPPAALKTLLRRPSVASKLGRLSADVDVDVDAGRVSGLVFVSERKDGLETLHVALRFAGDDKPKVLALADIFGDADFCGVRMEDVGGVGGGYKKGSRTVDHSLVYVSTKEPVKDRRRPWTVVYKTNLKTGNTERLTPADAFDLSPAVSPSGKRVAVASFQGKPWDGEVEDLQTDIYLMNADKPPLGRSPQPVIRNGGWPTWGSDDVLFFHRRVDTGRVIPLPSSKRHERYWSVFRYTISTGEIARVTPEGLDAVTPAAISETKVAVATIRQKSELTDERRSPAQHRHIEIFDITGESVQITLKTRPLADHFNPFVLDGGSRMGYHRCTSELLQEGEGSIPRHFHKLQSPHEDVGLFRVSGVFPTISKDGSMLAFVDNEFKAVWVADNQGLRIIHKCTGPNSVFSPMWNQKKDTLYVCMGPSFSAKDPLEIHAFFDVSQRTGRRHRHRRLTEGGFNNAFPSSSPDGSRFVFRSTRDHMDDDPKKRSKNLYIMEDGELGEGGGRGVTRLTFGGRVTDTHCQWSPRGDWVVFASNRGKPDGLPDADPDDKPDGLGYFAVYLVSVSKPDVVVRVIRSAGDTIAGHVNHPVFSPDMRSIAVTSDLAAVSADPISLPLFVHSVRPYGDIFVVDIDPDDIEKNKDVDAFRRVTHSRYENSTPAWTMFATDDPHAQWNVLVTNRDIISYKPACPYAYPGGGESWHMTGHLCLGQHKRCC
uniref:Dipeptidylpeptidase IV N-terminal domain-containing protein n=1 Tax=Oryza glumipatula TaxID=40148 RepID=A0A0E0BRZ9_9ORYZ